MKSFQEWKNEKQYLELNVNPNANPIIPVTNTNYRGVPPVVNAATTANNAAANPATTANPAVVDPAAAGSVVNPAIQSKVKRMQDVIGSLSPKDRIQAVGALGSGVRNDLVQDNKGNLNKVWARNAMKDSRNVLTGKNMNANNV